MPTFLYILCLFYTMAVAENSIALKSSGQLPACSDGLISYVVETDLNPVYKFSVFLIVEGTSADECANLCHTHFFCRSVGFEPNDDVPSGGLCYMSYKRNSKCLFAETQAKRVTDYQALTPVWLECDQCIQPQHVNSLQQNAEDISSTTNSSEDIDQQNSLNNLNESSK